MDGAFYCKWCDKRFLVARDHVDHEDACTCRTDQPKPPSAIVSSIGAAQFKRTDKPAHLRPVTALDAAYEYVRDDNDIENPISHIIVIIGRDVGPEGCSGTMFKQAGSYRHHAQMGLCLEAMHMMRESGIE